MPKLVNALSAVDRFNFMTALIGYLLRNNPVSVNDVATHFGVSPELVRSAISTIVKTEDTNPYGAKSFYNLEDWDVYLDGGDTITLELDPLNGANAQTDAPSLNTREAAAIVMGLQYLKTLPEFANEQDIDKLLEMLSKGQGIGSGAPSIVIRPGRIDADASVCRSAILEGKRIEFEYINQKGEKGRRQIDPIRLDPRENYWYVHGWCLINQDVRMFRLDRMRDAVILDEPIGEQAKSVIELDDRTYTERETDIDVTVAVAPEAYALLGEYQQDGEPKKNSNGEFVAVIRVGYLPNLGRLIARYGGKARVLEPAEARNIVRDHALIALGQSPLSTSEITED